MGRTTREKLERTQALRRARNKRYYNKRSEDAIARKLEQNRQYRLRQKALKKEFEDEQSKMKEDQKKEDEAKKARQRELTRLRNIKYRERVIIITLFDPT